MVCIRQLLWLAVFFLEPGALHPIALQEGSSIIQQVTWSDSTFRPCIIYLWLLRYVIWNTPPHCFPEIGRCKLKTKLPTGFHIWSVFSSLFGLPSTDSFGCAILWLSWQSSSMTTHFPGCQSKWWLQPVFIELQTETGCLRGGLY